MIKAVLCDDDEIILHGLTAVVQWESLGIEIIGTAFDGKKGLELVRRHMPDLLLTDIRMPYIDGLQLIEEAKRLNPSLLTVVFSGYDDFEYARKAVRLGVLDYLSKPIDIDEMMQVLRAAVRKYQVNREEFHRKREEALQNIYLNGLEETAGIEDIIYDYCGVIAAEVSGSRIDLNRFHTAASELCSQGLYLLSKEERRCILAITAPSRISVELRCIYCADYLRKEVTKTAADVQLTTASSDILEGLKNLGQCCRQAAEAMELKYIKGENENLKYMERKADQEKADLNFFLETDLVSPVKYGDGILLNEKLDELKAKLLEAGVESYLYLQFLVGNIYSNIIRELGAGGIYIEEVFIDPVGEYRQMIESSTIHVAMDNLSQNLKRICSFVSEQKSGRYSPPVYKAMQYIQARFMDAGLSMDDVAEAVHLSAGHFSTIFKQEVGQTFTDYLIQIRMERAKELIMNSGIKVYEIAAMSGYDNVPYFSTAFKRYTGYSPSEFKKSGKSGGA